jgi:hypothetical protein
MFNPLRAAAAPPPAMGMVSPCYRGNPPRVGSERLSTPGVEGVDFGASAERACERAKKEAPDFTRRSLFEGFSHSRCAERIEERNGHMGGAATNTHVHVGTTNVTSPGIP